MEQIPKQEINIGYHQLSYTLYEDFPNFSPNGLFLSQDPVLDTTLRLIVTSSYLVSSDLEVSCSFLVFHEPETFKDN